ncbi:hypothetical protein DL768_003341 [Monosporascus sp. mg162]|nr:hypothetical protein DL768_003341 [Monosporascus sp. mg162]
MSLEGVQVFCLLILTRETNSLSGLASVATESLLKLAFTIGLHLDPSTFPSLPKLQAELRRRLWVTVVEITVLTSLDSTLPLSPLVGTYSPKPPANIADEELIAASPSDGTPHTRFGGTDCSLQLLLLKSLPLRIQVVQQLNNVHHDLSYEKTLELGKSLSGHCREIAAYFEKGTGLFDSGLFHRKLLDTYMRRLILFLHRPFCLHARKDARFFIARKICLESTLITMGYVESLNLPFGPLDDFTRMSIRGSGLFKGGISSDVIYALSAEIVSQVEEENGSGEPASSAVTASDPLVQLSRANRQPLMRRLEHIHEQLRQILALGRPSVKQLIFTSGVLAQVKAMERGEHPRDAVIEALSESCKASVYLLRECGLSKGTPAMADDSNPFGFETLDWFGFDFSSLVSLQDQRQGADCDAEWRAILGPNFVLDITNILASPTLVSGEVMT